MQTSRPFEILFLTDFSNASYRTIPAMAQLADELDIRLTLLHACTDGKTSVAEGEAKLRSFFPEAAYYQGTQRVVLSTDVLSAVKQVRREQPVDLVVAPSSDPLGLPHLWHHSLRAELLARECGPVWTMGQSIHSTVLNRRTRNVGCWIDLDNSDNRHIGLAFTYASVLGAKLHLLSAMPNVDEGTLASSLYSDSPLYPDGVVESIQDLVGWVPVKPDVHVKHGVSGRIVPQLARDLNLDILFVSKRNALRSGWMKMSLESVVDRCPCPVVCSDGVARHWQLKRGRAFELQTASTKAA
jgi:nucleotide-binding universal stress UspA family protein